MKKHEFTDELRNRLDGIPRDELEKSLLYYEEMINDRMEDGMSEDEAVEDLGSLKSIADEILNALSIPALMKAKVTDNKNKSSNKGLWIALSIAGFPFWFPILIAFSAVIFSVYVVIWSLVIAFYAILVSLAVGSIAAFLSGIVLFFFRSPPASLFAIGTAFCLAAMTLFMITPTIFITKKLAQITKYFALKIKYLFIGRGEKQ